MIQTERVAEKGWDGEEYIWKALTEKSNITDA